MRLRSIVILLVIFFSFGMQTAFGESTKGTDPAKCARRESTAGLSPLCAPQGDKSTPSSQGASSPTEIAEQFISKIEKQLLTADYSIELLEGTQRQQVVSGNLQMLGNCFHMTILSTEAAFDGKTLYMYQEETNELTLSNPTDEELLDVNPMLFARALLRTSTVRFAANASKAANGKAANGKAKSNPILAAVAAAEVVTLDFIPINKAAGIQRFVIKLRKADLAPIEIQIREQQQQTIIHFSRQSFAPSSQPSSSLFQLEYPSAWLNDLR